MIYYPTIEPPKTLWLKYALLYFDELNPIIPARSKRLIGREYKKVLNETNLINEIKPDGKVGNVASLKAIDEIELILNNPFHKRDLLNDISINKKWNIEKNQNFGLYSEKYSSSWLDYCLKNNYCRENKEGMLIPEELAFIFMTNLAKTYGKRMGKALITDVIKYDSYISYTEAEESMDRQKHKVARGILSKEIPINLKDIPIDKIIRFRNRNISLINAFNSQLTKLYKKNGESLGEGDFRSEFNRVYSELTSAILTNTIGIASIPFALYVLIGNPSSENAEYVKEILGAMGITIGGYYGVKSAYNSSKEKILTKRYLAQLGKIF